MIRIMNQGGLGNQLFVWNAAHSIAKTYGEKVAVCFVNDGKKRQTGSVAAVKELTSYCSHGIVVIDGTHLNYVFKVLDKIGSKHSKLKGVIARILGIQDVSDPEAMPMRIRSKPRIIRGFFQDSDDVWTNRRTILDELNPLLDNFWQKCLKKKFDYKEFEYTALHFRRGDYRVNSKSLGLLSFDYYKKSLNQSDSLIVTSDSPDIQDSVNSHFPEATFYSPKEFNEWETLSILSRSKMLLVANSTFSWWAGLVAIDLGGTVIAPKPWFLVPQTSINYLNLPPFIYVTSEFEQ